MSPSTTPLPADLRDDFAEVGEVRLHYVEAGEGPLVVLLHGFPEFWYGWRHQIGPLARAGFRVVAPDLRGYNLSSKPQGVAAYRVERPAADVRGLVRALGVERAHVVGHDWGAITGWTLAAEHPEVVDRLVILNGPHPRRIGQVALRDPRQLLRVWYAGLFQVPWLPERALALGDWKALRDGLRRSARPGAFTDAELVRYMEAWSRPGAMTAMLSYYRAVAPWTGGLLSRKRAPVQAPTRVIWGERDAALLPKLAEPEREDVPNLERVVRLPEAGHWLQHEEPERVTQLVLEFLR